MKISDVLRSLVDIVDKNSAQDPVVAGQEDNTSFTGTLRPVVLPDVKSQEGITKSEKTPAGNDEQPEELFLPPLQMKMELLKKAVDVENVYDDGTPTQQEDTRIEQDGAWTGPEKHYEFIGASTGVVEGGSKDTSEKTEEKSMTETEKLRQLMNRLDEESTEKRDTHAEKAGKKVAKDIEWDEKHKDHIHGKKRDSEDDKAEKAGKKVAKDIEWDEKHRTDEAKKSKKADKDYDGDGEIESEKDEVWGSRLKAGKVKTSESIRDTIDRLTAILESCECCPGGEHVEEGQLNEYLVRPGDSAEAVLALNLFQDQESLGNDPSFARLLRKYGPVADKLERQLMALGRPLTDAEADAIESVWYDGSDAYDSGDLNDLARIYDEQIEVIQALLAGEFEDENVGLYELSPNTLKSYIKKARDDYGRRGVNVGKIRANRDDVDRFTNRHMSDKFGMQKDLYKAVGADHDSENVAMRAAGKRSQGIDRALDRLEEVDAELSRIKELANPSVNPVILDELSSDFPE